jgi:hypothetical protein
VFHCHTYLVDEKVSIGLNLRWCNFTFRIINAHDKNTGKNLYSRNTENYPSVKMVAIVSRNFHIIQRNDICIIHANLKRWQSQDRFRLTDHKHWISCTSKLSSFTWSKASWRALMEDDTFRGISLSEREQKTVIF